MDNVNPIQLHSYPYLDLPGNTLSYTINITQYKAGIVEYNQLLSTTVCASQTAYY